MRADQAWRRGQGRWGRGKGLRGCRTERSNPSVMNLLYKPSTVKGQERAPCTWCDCLPARASARGAPPGAPMPDRRPIGDTCGLEAGRPGPRPRPPCAVWRKTRGSNRNGACSAPGVSHRQTVWAQPVRWIRTASLRGCDIPVPRTDYLPQMITRRAQAALRRMARAMRSPASRRRSSGSIRAKRTCPSPSLPKPTPGETTTPASRSR